MQVIIRKASVRWVAGAHGGARAVTTDSRALTRAPFSFGRARAGNGDTNPAELIAAAQAGSFSLALAGELGKKGQAAGEIIVSAAVTLEHLAAGWTITNIHLGVVARLPRLSQGEFIDATVRAKTNCPVCRALRPTLSMNAKLERVARRRARRSPATPLPPASRRSSVRRSLAR